MTAPDPPLGPSPAAFAAFAGTPVAVLGDVMLDEYIWGEASRISPEAPVPVVRVVGRTERLGGAANVAAGVQALGGHPLLGGVVGSDPAGRQLTGLVASTGITTAELVVDPGRPTTTKTRVIAASQQVVRTDVESTAGLEDAVEERLLAWFEDHIGTARCVVLSDYAKGVVTGRVAKSVIGGATARAVPVVVDPKGVDYERFAGATVLTPNVAETARAAAVEIDGDASLARAGRALSDRTGAAVLVTCGARGMQLFGPEGGAPLPIPAVAREVFDVTGAGDTVVATLALALAGGLDLADAARLATLAAGAVIAKVGASVVTLAELEDLARHVGGGGR